MISLEQERQHRYAKHAGTHWVIEHGYNDEANIHLNDIKDRSLGVVVPRERAIPATQQNTDALDWFLSGKHDYPVGSAR